MRKITIMTAQNMTVLVSSFILDVADCYHAGPCAIPCPSFTPILIWVLADIITKIAVFHKGVKCELLRVLGLSIAIFVYGIDVKTSGWSWIKSASVPAS